MFKPYGKRSILSFVAASSISDKLDAWPTVYAIIQKSRLRHARHRMVNRNTKIALEAFPRSGSSFAHSAFLFSNPDCAGMVATHMHRATQVKLAVQNNVPTVVLVRHPRDAVTSLIALAVQNNKLPMPNFEESVRCFQASLLRYSLFHERIENLTCINFASFEEVTQDFGHVIARVNASCGTNFLPFEHSLENVAAIASQTRRHATPNKDRTRLKGKLFAVYSVHELAALRKRSEAAYSRILSRRASQLSTLTRNA